MQFPRKRKDPSGRGKVFWYQAGLGSGADLYPLSSGISEFLCGMWLKFIAWFFYHRHLDDSLVWHSITSCNIYGAFFSTREEKGELALKNKSDCWLLYLVFICSKHIQVSFPITVEAVQYTIDLEERSKCVYLLEHYRHTMWHYFGIIVSIHGCLSLRLRSSDSRIEVLSIYWVTVSTVHRRLQKRLLWMCDTVCLECLSQNLEKP